MLTATPYIYTMFQYITADVASKYGSNVHYEHGHPLEIINTLKGMNKTPAYDAVKYPCIALFQDFEEKKCTGKLIQSEVSLNLIIAALSKPDDVAPQRLTRTYIPTLYPIYDYLTESILKSGYFSAYSILDCKHTKIDRMYWGKKGLFGSEGNIFGDHVDVIEIQNLQLIVKDKTKNCI